MGASKDSVGRDRRRDGVCISGEEVMARIVRRKRGDTLLPRQFPENVVAGLKMKPREWSGQYEQDPVPQSGQIFDPSWWRYYKNKEAPEFELITLSVDCSFRATSTSDYVCLQKWGQVSSRSYLLDCRTERLGFAATKAAIKVMQREGRPASAVLIEARANGDAIIEELKADPDFGAALVAVEPEGGKERARMRLRSIAKQGTCIFPRT